MISFVVAKNELIINEIENMQCEWICDELMKK